MKELFHTEGEEALVLLEAVEWMQFTACNGKITSVDVAFVSAEQPGEICSLVASFLGTRCKNWGWGVVSRPVKQLSGWLWEKLNLGCSAFSSKIISP